jgi:hypothetical protein
MIFTPQALGSTRLTREELAQDKKGCLKFGPCGVGSKAIYLNSFYIERQYYLPLSSVTRVFKRIAMSKGGFTGKGMFATIPYLVVEYDNGRQKQCNFKQEEQVDQLLDYLKKTHPEIRLHSAQSEQKLLEKQRRMEAKKHRVVSKKAAADIAELERCCDYLDQKADLSSALSSSARRMRVYERSNPAYKWVALFIVLMGVVSLVYGIYALVTHAGFAMYFLLFGLAAIFLFSSANVLPTARNNRSYIENQLKKSIEEMEAYICKYPDFPLPACYAHPIVLRRMIEILADGRADSIPESLDVLKQDLKALNSSVAVEQEEYDEVTTIKPMFLVMDYK